MEYFIDNIHPEFDSYIKYYIEIKSKIGFSLEIKNAFKVMFADYDMALQNEENNKIPYCLIGSFYIPSNDIRHWRGPSPPITNV